MKEQIIIFDTTLRDGEQSPGASMTKNEKIQIAQALENLNVDVIEAGFPIASEGDFQAVKEIATIIKNSTVCGLARALDNDIKRAGEAIKHAKSGRIHTFIATSPLHMKHKLRMNEDEVIQAAINAIRLASKYTDDIEFSPEDAGRSNTDFLCKILEIAINEGANTINIPDTVGYNMPSQYGNLIQQLITRIPNADKAVFSCHCHNDLGVAVANSIAGLMNGARQIECTINGLGERAGNTALEEIVMAVRTRPDFFNLDTRINTKEIVPTSKLVAGITGFPIQSNKAIVGANAFAHESGIHQDGILKHRETYEIMLAQDVGWNTNKLVLGKHSGRNAFANRLGKLGHKFADTEELDSTFARFKALADIKHEIFDEDLISLISTVELNDEKYKLVELNYHFSYGQKPTATIEIEMDGVKNSSSSSGIGVVDAVFKAIENIVNSKASLLLYAVNSVTDGTDSLGEISVRLSKKVDTNNITINGHSADPDIITASAKAYLNALNKMNSQEGRINPQGFHTSV